MLRGYAPTVTAAGHPGLATEGWTVRDSREDRCRGYSPVVRALVIEHGPDGGAEGVGDRLKTRGFTLESFQVLDGMDDAYSDRPFPDTVDYDLVVIMGSVHSVYDTETIGSWIGREISMVSETVAADRPVLGICFGGQVLSAALGGTVEAAHGPEVGWHTTQSKCPNGLFDGPWFQWHVDRFTLPASSVELARNEHGVQAFRSGRSLGTQFHPEVTPSLVGNWLAQLDEWVKRTSVDPEELLAETQKQHPEALPRADRLVDWFLDEVAFP